MLLLCFQVNRSSRLGSDEYRESVIQQHKEQLYDLIAEADPDSMTLAQNSSLLKDLSTQIKPRPHDPQWYNINHMQTYIDVYSFFLLLPGFFLKRGDPGLCISTMHTAILLPG